MARFQARLALSAALAIAGCVGPDFHRPAPPATDRYQPHPPVSTDPAQRYVQGLDIPGQWWTLFHSAALNRLITESLAANPTLDAAEAALRQARDAVYAQEGSYLPSVSADFGPSRTKTATRSLSVASGNGSPYFSLWTGEVTVSYTPDLFGLNRRTVEGLAAASDAARYQLEASYLTLTSNLVLAAINEASLRAQIDATMRTIAVQTELLGILEQQRTLGQISEVDVLAQKAALAQTEAGLPPLRRQFDQQRDALAVLAGRRPDQDVAAQFVLADITLPVELPVSLPASLISQRPDILVAEADLHGASAAVGVAIANRLPMLNLTAAAGTQANHFQDMFASGNGFWAIAATVSEPIFDAGTLLHKERAARAALDQAKAQYRSTVLAALQNVADSLAALQSDGDAVRTARNAADAAQASLKLVRLQLELGQVAYALVLNAEQTAQTTTVTLAAARAAQLSDTAALFAALGGGWWHRQDSKVADPRGDSPLGVLGLN